MNKKLIGITGKKCSGKSTIVACMVKWCCDKRLNCIEIGLGDMVREDLYQTIGALDGVLETGKNSTPIIRKLQQWWGMERRAEDPNYWIKKVKVCLGNDADVWIIHGVRFLNEAKWIKDNGGIIIRIVRTTITSNDTHISETEMDLITPDKVIYNASTLEDLRSDVYRCLDEGWIPI